MSKQVINASGKEETVPENGVREDTAAAARGTTWALISVGAFILIGAIIFLAFFFSAATDNKPNETPGQMANRTTR